MANRSGYWADNYQNSRVSAAEATRQNGIKGLTAYTSRDNKAMFTLLHSLDYHVKTSSQGSTIYIEASFAVSPTTAGGEQR
jgi:hypothetical protein